MWIGVVLLAAIFLGLYDVMQKVSLRDNAMQPVLLLSIVSSAVILTPLLIISEVSPETMRGTMFYVPEVDARTHLFIIVKSLIVLASWVFGYAGMKHLPLTIVSPVKATQPIWTVVGAIVIFSEQLNVYQALGVIAVILCLCLFSRVGKKEGISFVHDKWILCLIASTLIGASSGLYDKYLMREFDRMAVQVYFTYYQVIAMGILAVVLWYPKRRVIIFKWRWSIPLIGLFLSCSDFLYFYALSLPESLISLISPLRRASFVIPFIYGAVVCHEQNVKEKLQCIVLLVVGVAMIAYGSC